MARTKKFRPGKTKTPKPAQNKLEGFTDPALEALEGAIEKFATVQDRVKAAKKKLQNELDSEEANLIAAMRKANQDSIVIGGYTVQVIKTTKAKVKGAPRPKAKEEDDDTQIEISMRGRSVTLTPAQLQEAAESAGVQE